MYRRGIMYNPFEQWARWLFRRAPSEPCAHDWKPEPGVCTNPNRAPGRCVKCQTVAGVPWHILYPDVTFEYESYDDGKTWWPVYSYE